MNRVNKHKSKKARLINDGTAPLVQALLSFTSPVSGGLTEETRDKKMILWVDEYDQRDTPEETLAKSNAPQKALDILTADLTLKEIYSFFTYFSRGLQYVYEEYGLAPERLFLTNCTSSIDGKNYERIGYTPEGDTLIITLSSIKKWADIKRKYSIGKTPHMENYMNMDAVAFSLGVEEAYHYYQNKKMGHLYSKHNADTEISRVGEEAHYANNKREVDAGVVVREALKQLGFGRI